MSKSKILVVDDEKDINELIQYNLEKEGYRAIPAFDGESALKIAERESVNLIILDLMLPEIDGLEVCRYLKQGERTQHIPIIMLTAKGEESDVVVGLKMGADDYVTKPFSPKILLARIKTVLKRSVERRPILAVRKIGSLTIDIPRHKVNLKNKVIELTTIEFNILDFLSRHPGRVFSRDQIMDGAWKEGKFIVDRAVDVHIRGLRKKLGQAADAIETVRGVGYRFKERAQLDE